MKAFHTFIEKILNALAGTPSVESLKAIPVRIPVRNRPF